MPGTLPLKWIVTLLGISIASVFADAVIVESKLNSALTASAITPDPPYKELSGQWNYSSVKSTAPGCSPDVGARYTGVANGAFRVRPTLAEPGGTYFMEITFASPNESPNVLV